MNILLVNAPHTEAGERVRRLSRPWAPLDLLKCAALLRQGGHDVPDQIRDEAVAQADRIVVTTTPLNRWQCPTLDTDATLQFLHECPGHKTANTAAALVTVAGDRCV